MNQTIREALEKHLYDHAIFEDQAKAMVLLYEAGYAESLEGRLDDNVSDYPEAFLITAKLGLRPYVVQWFDENLPNAFQRSLFL